MPVIDVGELLIINVHDCTLPLGAETDRATQQLSKFIQRQVIRLHQLFEGENLFKELYALLEKTSVADSSSDSEIGTIIVGLLDTAA